MQKPKLSQKAWNRLSNKNRRKVNPGGSGGGHGGKEASPQPGEGSPTADDAGMWSCDVLCESCDDVVERGGVEGKGKE